MLDVSHEEYPGGMRQGRANRGHDEAAAGGGTMHGRDSETPAYEPPSIERLGTLAELTGGVNPTTSDGVGPGSLL